MAWVVLLTATARICASAMVEATSARLHPASAPVRSWRHRFAYMAGGRFPDSWKGFTARTIQNLGAFVKLSLGSAIMICLEFWYYTTLLVLVGLLKHARLQIYIVSVCLNYEFMTIMVALGFSTAVGIRVSNELGASRPKETKFAVVVAVSTSIFIGSIFMSIVLIWRTSLPKFFSDSGLGV